MNFYQDKIATLNSRLYSKDQCTGQIIGSKNFIDSNFSNSIGLNDISGSAYYSKFHFTRLFKKCYGQTVIQYMTDMRLREARKLLQSGLSVSKTCFSLGFGSISSFSGLFKKAAGVTPGQYKKAILKK